MNTNEKHHRAILQSIAHRAMLERAAADSAAALAQLDLFRRRQAWTAS